MMSRLLVAVSTLIAVQFQIFRIVAVKARVAAERLSVASSTIAAATE